MGSITFAFPLLVALYTFSLSTLGFGVYVAVTTKVPEFLLWRGAQPADRQRTRLQGIGVALIGAYLTISVLAADLSRRQAIPSVWVFVLWVSFILAMVAVALMSRRYQRRAR
jgi:hypothetical protein